MVCDEKFLMSFTVLHTKIHKEEVKFVNPNLKLVLNDLLLSSFYKFSLLSLLINIEMLIHAANS